MSFSAVLFALLIEQLKPLPRDNRVHDALQSWVGWTGRNFDAGKPHHAWKSHFSICLASTVSGSRPTIGSSLLTRNIAGQSSGTRHGAMDGCCRVSRALRQLCWQRSSGASNRKVTTLASLW